MRIREGDPLEIYTDADGEVIFKKYSQVGELSSLTAQYAEVLHKNTGLPVVITDRDRGHFLRGRTEEGDGRTQDNAGARKHHGEPQSVYARRAASGFIR